MNKPHLDGQFLKQSSDFDAEDPLYELDITAVTALTAAEVAIICDLLVSWGYQLPEAE